jgi:hypothetical protein
MARRATLVLAAALLCLTPVAGHAALSAYLGTFEGMGVGEIGAPNSLSTDGWLAYGNVFTPAHVYDYGYGPYPAPNDGAAFCAVVTGQGGDLQGANQLSVYSDYNNQTPKGHATGYFVEANVYHEQTVSAGDVGNTWTLQFDAKLGNLAGGSTALAFIKTIDPNNGWQMTNFITVNTTAIPATWNTYTISIPVDAGLVGQFMQFGFSNTATHNEPSAVIYDNVVWHQTAGADVGDGTLAGGLALSAAAPNPFQHSTRLGFTMPQRGDADLAVFDVTGRRVATLFHGAAEPGQHSATWDGRSSDGSLAPSGVYRCVLQTAAGRQARSLVLSR